MSLNAGQFLPRAMSVASSEADAHAATPRPGHLTAESSFADNGPALVVFSGGTAFNSVAGAHCIWLHYRDEAGRPAGAKPSLLGTSLLTGSVGQPPDCPSLYAS